MANSTNSFLSSKFSFTFPTFHNFQKTLVLDGIVSRSVSKVIKSGVFKEGGGFTVIRPFPTKTMDMMDPFLMLDHLPAKLYGPHEFPGAPSHPHRGFETVSCSYPYVFHLFICFY